MRSSSSGAGRRIRMENLIPFAAARSCRYESLLHLVQISPRSSAFAGSEAGGFEFEREAEAGGGFGPVAGAKVGEAEIELGPGVLWAGDDRSLEFGIGLAMA